VSTKPKQDPTLRQGAVTFTLYRAVEFRYAPRSPSIDALTITQILRTY